MFQNLQTWHIIAIVFGIFAVVAIAVYMMKENKDDKKGEKKGDNKEEKQAENKEEKESENKEEKQAEFSHLTKMINASSGNRLIASSAGGESSASAVVDNLFKELGMALCNKPIEYEKRQELYDNLYRKIKIPINAGMLNLYVFLSDKLTLAQKKDFITSIVIQIEQENIIRNPGSLHSLKLIEDGNVECKGMFPFCYDKNIFTIKEFGDELYEMVTSIFDKNKYMIMRRNIFKVKGKADHEILDNGVVKITKKQYTEEEINSAIEQEEKEWEEKISKLKNEMATNPFCTLY